MLRKLPLEMIPEEDKLDYLRSHRKIQQIIKELRGFRPDGQNEQQWLKEILQEYEVTFKKIEQYNRKINRIS